MNIFIDANVLVAIINKELPLFTYAAPILSMQDKQGIRIYTSPVCLAVAFYFAEKKYGSATAKAKLSILIEHINIAIVTENTVRSALQNPQVLDLEDGIQYYSALEAKCNLIVTEDVGDYYFASIDVMDCRGFLASVNRLL